jgi:hypothetical protein
MSCATNDRLYDLVVRNFGLKDLFQFMERRGIGECGGWHPLGNCGPLKQQKSIPEMSNLSDGGPVHFAFGRSGDRTKPSIANF